MLFLLGALPGVMVAVTVAVRREDRQYSLSSAPPGRAVARDDGYLPPGHSWT
ncbi:MAG: hypothetical protein ACRDOL_41705 [Streptosporangiaceae bacterium]